MEKEQFYIAVDLGAESGRVMLGGVKDGLITLEEMYRFSNGPITENGALRWDFAKLFSEVKTGLKKALEKTKGNASGIAVDSWGVDYGLIDSAGKLIGNPFHYRDNRNNGMPEKAFAVVPKREIYGQTGIQFMQINTLYQLLSEKLSNATQLAKAKCLLFTADLVGYHLCGRQYAEYSLASTSQMLNMNTGKWAFDILNRLGIGASILPEIVKSGTVVGKLKPELCNEFGCGPVPVIAAGSHDTACAVAAVPTAGKNWAYVSSGTWSLMGIESPKAIINDKSFEYQFTNEGGVCNTVRFLKNIMGLWLVQECRRQWQREGGDFSYAQLTEMATKAKPFAAFVDPQYDELLTPGDMPAKINRYLASTGQPAISDKGQMIRVILESLALEYARVMNILEEISGARIDVLHIVGGGIKNELLCQFAADAINRNVITGPVEATALGNILMQAMATGQVKSLQQARDIVRASSEVKTYKPENAEEWAKQYKVRIRN
jgi:rhamnulokinase